MLYMIAREGDVPLVTLWLDEAPTLDVMAESVAALFGYESVEQLAQANPGLCLGWFYVH